MTFSNKRIGTLGAKLATVNWWRFYVFALFVVGVLTLLRGFAHPLRYPLYQWLTTYEFGFIKRGLVGTAIAPLLAYKSGVEVTRLIVFLANAALFFKLLCLGYFAREMLLLGRERFRAGGSLLFVVTWVFFTSSYVVFTGHAVGYFDHFLETITLVSLVAIYRRRYIWVPLLCILGLAIHEMFAVYGALIVFATLFLQFQASAGDGQRRWRPFAKQLAAITIPIVIFGLFMLYTQRSMDEEVYRGIRDEAVKLDAMPVAGIENMVQHLRESVVVSWNLQRDGKFAARLKNAEVAWAIYPPVLFLIVVGGVLLHRAKKMWLLPLFIGVVLSSLLLNLIAWDQYRFACFALFSAYLLIFSVTRFWKQSLDLSWRLQLLLCALGLGISVNSLFQPTPLMADAKDKVLLLAPRTNVERTTFARCEPLFKNSTFDTGNLHNWTPHAEAFADRHGAVKSQSRRRGSLGSHWIGTYSKLEQHGGRPAGDSPTGRLVSEEFTIVGGNIIFLLGGGDHADETYVALFVGGIEVERSSGRNRDHMTPRIWNVETHRGKRARIEVVDRHSGSWGHVNVDQFCWYR